MDTFKGIAGAICILVVLMAMFGSNTHNSTTTGSTSSVSTSDIDKILDAKAQVRAIVNYPDTLDFHEMKTMVNGSTVTLTFTASNAFGVPETHTMDISVN